MKNKITILAAVIFLTHCTPPPEKQNTGIHGITIRVIEDVTDRIRIHADCKQASRLFHADKYPDAAFNFHIDAISDRKNSPSFSSRLAEGKATAKENRFDDVQYRKKRIRQFYRETKQVCTNFYTEFDTTKAQSHSECWTAICGVLQQLALDTSDRKYLLIYSDLMENSAFNSYHGLEKMSVTAIAQKLIQTCPVPKGLQGIRVVVVYAPDSREHDKKFAKMYEAVKILLEREGAVVSKQSTNQFDDL